MRPENKATVSGLTTVGYDWNKIRRLKIESIVKTASWQSSGTKGTNNVNNKYANKLIIKVNLNRVMTRRLSVVVDHRDNSQ